MKRISWFLFILLSASCLDDPDCFRLNNNLVGISFKVLGVGNDNVPLILIQAPAVAGDTVFYAGKEAQTIILPLNVLEEETLFHIHGLYETKILRLGYKRQIQFVSEDCGERFVYANLHVLEHDFDSVRIVNSTPTPTGAATNIELYRCVRTNLALVEFKNDDGSEKTVMIGGVQTSSVFITLDVNSDNTIIELPFDSGLKNISFSYHRTGATLNNFCGEQMFLSRLKIAATDLDTLRTTTPNDSIQDPPLVNFEITL